MNHRMTEEQRLITNLPPEEAAATQATTKATTSGAEMYWPQLDGIRSLAFLLVFVHHVGRIPQAQRVLPEVILKVVDTISAWGWVGVDIFFTLSGFLITHLLLAEKKQFSSISFKLFFARRALRIWPVYYLLLFFAIILVPVLHWQSLNLKLYGEFLLKQGLPLALFCGNISMAFPSVMIKFMKPPDVFLLLPTWSLAVEEQFYLTWPFLLKILPTPKAIYRLILALTVLSLAARALLWYVSHYLVHMTYPVSLYYYFTLSHLEPLMAGAICAVTISYFPEFKEKIAKLKTHIFVALGFLIVFCTAVFPEISKNSYLNIFMFSCVAMGCLLFLVSALVSPAVAKIFSNKVLASFGKLTYAMYLVHMYFISLAEIWLQDLFKVPLTSPFFWILKFSLALSLSYGFAFVSWHLLESRFLKMRKLFRRHA